MNSFACFLGIPNASVVVVVIVVVVYALAVLCVVAKRASEIPFMMPDAMWADVGSRLVKENHDIT